MCEKRGYPNPNYEEQDILPEIPMEIKTDLILDDQMVEFIQKAALFDCLTAAIRKMGKVDDDVVRAITGAIDPKENEELEKFRSWWHESYAKNDELEKRVKKLENLNAGLKDIIQKNGIELYDSEPAEVKESE